MPKNTNWKRQKRDPNTGRYIDGLSFPVKPGGPNRLHAPGTKRNIKEFRKRQPKARKQPQGTAARDTEFDAKWEAWGLHLTKRELKSTNRYLYESGGLNSSLRNDWKIDEMWGGGVETPSPETKQLISDLDSTMKTLPEDVTLWRGMGDPKTMLGVDVEVGGSWVDKGYVSSSTTESIADHFKEGADFAYSHRSGPARKTRITFKAGTGAIWLGNRGRQSELIHQRGLRYTITKINPDGSLEIEATLA